MAINALYENSATVSTTEYSLPNNSTTLTPKTDDGVFQLFLDMSALAAGDTYELKIYEKVQSAGTQRLIDTWIIDGAQARPHWVSSSWVLLHGWDITLKKLAGTDRVIGWSVRQIA